MLFVLSVDPRQVRDSIAAAASAHPMDHDDSNAIGETRTREERHLFCVLCMRKPAGRGGGRKNSGRIQKGRNGPYAGTPFPPGKSQGTYAHKSCSIQFKYPNKNDAIESVSIPSSIQTVFEHEAPPSFELEQFFQLGDEWNHDYDPHELSEPTTSSGFESSSSSEMESASSTCSEPNIDDAPLEHQSTLDATQRKCFFEKYSFACVKSPPEWKLQLALSARNLAITTKESNNDLVTSQIAGSVTMYNLEKIEAYRSDKHFQAQLHGVAIDASAAVGLDLRQTHELVAPKLLKVEPGAGEQVIHWDTSDAWDKRGTYAVIFNCSEDVAGINTTAVPRFSTKREFDFPGPSSATVELDQEKMRSRVHLLKSEWYHRVPFHTGETMFFEQTIPHKGTANDSKKTRVVLFCLLQPLTERKRQLPPREVLKRTAIHEARKEADENQYFSWMFIHDAFVQSDSEGRPLNKPMEYAEALFANKKESPIERYEQEEAREYAYTCLKHFGLFCRYVNAAKPTKKVVFVFVQSIAQCHGPYLRFPFLV